MPTDISRTNGSLRDLPLPSHRSPGKPVLLFSKSDEGLLRNLRARFFGRPAHRLMEEEEHVPFLARILTVAQSLAVVLVLGHSEVPLLFGASLTVRILLGMALGVLIVTVVAADYCLIKTMQRVPVLARRNQWFSVGAYLAYALFVGLVEISTYAVVLYILDRDPQALLQPTPLLPTAGLIFIAQVVLRAALIFWTMVQLFLTARKLPVQPNTLTDHSAELLGGKALELIKELDTEHADLPMIFQAYAASVETTVRGTGGLLGWGPFRKRADAATSVRKQQWTDLVAILKQFSASRQDELERELQAARKAEKQLIQDWEQLEAECETKVVTEVGQRLSALLQHLRVAGEFPSWATELAPEVAELLPGLLTSERRRAVRPTEVKGRLDQVPSAAEQRREFMEQHNVRAIKLEAVRGDWLGAAEILRIVRRDALGKRCMGETRAREMIQAIGKPKQKVGGRMRYVASFDNVMRALMQSGMLDEEALSWWASYSATTTEPERE